MVIELKKNGDQYKITEIGCIPYDWRVRKLEEIFEICQYGISNSLNDKGKYIVLRMNNIKDGSVSFNDLKYADLEESEFNKYCLKSNDILFNRTNSLELVGKTGIYDSDEVATFASYLIRIRINNELADSKFVNYYMNSNKGQERIKAFATLGVSQVNINAENLKKVLIPIPSLKEQKKISLVISSVDEEIEITKKLIERTKELKKGLMQKLLTKGIKHSSFKDTEIGKIPEEWEIRGLFDISQGKGEYGIGAVATEYVVGNPRYLRITDIGDESKLLFNDIKGLNDEEYEKYLLKYNDIVFARTGNTTGKSYVYDIKDGELVYAGFLIKFSINSKLANVNFIKYVIQSKRYWDWVNVMSTRSGQPGINSNEYAKFLIQLPGIEEQNQISLILSSVDEQIEQIESKKEKLQELKKGLIQKLLTGSIRVQ